MSTAGLSFFLGATLILLGILTAEIFYSGYSISLDMISTLGASPPPDSVVKEPSAAIFDYSMIISGLLIILGSVIYAKVKNREIFSIVIGLVGVGGLGVGLFPASHSQIHPIFALLTFLSGGIAALLSSRFSPKPFSYIELILGFIILVFLGLGVLMPTLIVPGLGGGGVERWIAYPLIIWLLGFGSNLMAVKKSK